jgi:hypothetical protein
MYLLTSVSFSEIVNLLTISFSGAITIKLTPKIVSILVVNTSMLIFSTVVLNFNLTPEETPIHCF